MQLTPQKIKHISPLSSILIPATNSGWELHNDVLLALYSAIFFGLSCSIGPMLSLFLEGPLELDYSCDHTQS